MVSQSVTESIAWIYFQETNDIGAAIAAEKQIKGLSRSKKIALIEAENPKWQDLSDES